MIEGEQKQEMQLMQELQKIQPIESQSQSILETLVDPVSFAERLLNVKLYDWQKEVLRSCVKNKRVTIRASRQIGKTFTLAIFCLYWAFIVPKQSIIILAPTLRQAQNMFNITKHLILQSKILQSKTIDYQVSKISFDNHSIIKIIPAGVEGKTIRGETANVLVLDESAFIKDNIFYEVATPMVAATDGKIIQSSTPISRNHFWEACKDSSSYVKHHIPFQVGINTNHYKQSFIDEQKKMLSAPRFAREYLATFTEDENIALPYDVLAPNLIESDLPTTHTEASLDYEYITIGIDIGRFGSSTVFSVIGWNEEMGKLIFLKEMKKTDTNVQFHWFKQVQQYFQPKKVTIDATGMGISFYERVKADPLINSQIVPIKFSVQMKETMFENFRKLLENRQLKIPNNKKLLDQLLSQEYRINAQGMHIFICPEGENDDLLWATVLAVYSAKMGQILGYVVTH